MKKIIARTLLGAVLGFALYAGIRADSMPGAGHMLLSIAWGIGMGNAMTACLRIVSRALSWAANLSIIAFSSFGTGIIGFVFFMIVLGFVLTVGWLGGWFVLIRDLIRELR